MEEKIEQIVNLFNQAENGYVFTGAGISVESGIPPYRGEGGLWNNYDPQVINLHYFKEHPEYCWKQLKKMFNQEFQNPVPNQAHKVVAKLEEAGLIKGVITQNIDLLHEQAGSTQVCHLHGEIGSLVCLECGEIYDFRDQLLQDLPPYCPECEGLLKPDVVFFNEQLPEDEYRQAAKWIENSELLILIGTAGEVAPANRLPFQAKNQGADIVEINPNQSKYTAQITDIFLDLPATEAMEKLGQRLL